MTHRFKIQFVLTSFVNTMSLLVLELESGKSVLYMICTKKQTNMDGLLTRAEPTLNMEVTAQHIVNG